jgi:hypothetical protein
MGAFPRHVRFVSIYSKADRMSPFPACILETDKGTNLYNIELPGVGHREFILKRSVYDVVRQELALGLGEKAEREVPPRPHLIER